MIKGLLALIKSGFLFKPFTIAGVIFGGYFAYINPKNADLYIAIKTAEPYLQIAVIAFFISIFSKESYEYDNFKLKAFFSKFTSTFIHTLIIFICSICFILLTSVETSQN